MANFQSVALALLQGEIIDNVRFSPEFRYLEDPVNRDEIDQWLEKIGRKSHKLGDGAGYYCIFLNPNNPQAQTQIQQQFADWVGKMEPLVQWLILCRKAKTDAPPLSAGEHLDASQLLAAIEQSVYLGQQLRDITGKLERANTNRSAKDMLFSVLDYLEKHHYLEKEGGSGSSYVATGKWSLFYEQLEFIKGYDQIQDEAPQQPDFYAKDTP